MDQKEFIPFTEEKKQLLNKKIKELLVSGYGNAQKTDMLIIYGNEIGIQGERHFAGLNWLVDNAEEYVKTDKLLVEVLPTLERSA